MSAAPARSDAALEETVLLSLGSRLDLDVAYCDLVHARSTGHEGPFDLRFRGTRRPDGARIRFFTPLLQVEGGLLTAKALRAPVSTDGVPPNDKGALLAIALEHHALSFTKARIGNGTWCYLVAVRDGADATDLADYLRALRDAGERAAPVLAGMGYAVGAAEIISVAGELVSMRKGRVTHGGGNG